MVVHHQTEIINAFQRTRTQLRKCDAWRLVCSRTKGAAKDNKFKKAWERLREKGTIVKTPSKRYLLSQY